MTWDWPDSFLSRWCVCILLCSPRQCLLCCHCLQKELSQSFWNGGCQTNQRGEWSAHAMGNMPPTQEYQVTTPTREGAGGWVGRTTSQIVDGSGKQFTVQILAVSVHWGCFFAPCLSPFQKWLSFSVRGSRFLQKGFEPCGTHLECWTCVSVMSPAVRGQGCEFVRKAFKWQSLSGNNKFSYLPKVWELRVRCFSCCDLIHNQCKTVNISTPGVHVRWKQFRSHKCRCANPLCQGLCLLCLWNIARCAKIGYFAVDFRSNINWRHLDW